MELKKIGHILSMSKPLDLISRMDDKRSKVLNAHQGKFVSQWSNVFPCKNLGLKLDDQQLRISTGLRLGANIRCAYVALW